jgi:hypothetical protein
MAVFLLGLALLAGIVAFFFYSPKPDPTFASVVRTLEKMDPNSMFVGEDILGELLDLGPEAYPHLSRILLRRDSRLEKVYDWCWGNTPSWIQSKLPQRKSKEPLRHRVAVIHAQIGTNSPQVFSTLEKALTHGNAELRAAAARGVGNFGPKALPVLPTLLDLLKEPHFSVVEAALTSIGNIGPEASPALPMLGKWADPRVWERIGGFDQSRHKLPLPTAAAISLFKIDPNLGKDSARVMARSLKAAFPETELELLKPMGELLTAELIPALKEGPYPQRFFLKRSLRKLFRPFAKIR